MKEISWLHFSDLHWGQKGLSHYWPTYKARLKEDIKFLREVVERDFDVVFFTGDLAFSGQREEYTKLSEALQEMWTWFAEVGSRPILIPIPGNHDLSRPQNTHPAVLSLKQWEENSELREEFWTDSNSFFRKTIREVFSPYMDWFNSKPVPMPDNFNLGILPGDFSLTIEQDNFKLGVVGLNTTFLQLSGDDFRGKLAISAKQILPLVNQSPDDWCNEHNFNVLLTHHSPAWLNNYSASDYRSEINPPARFDLHLYGHLHEAETLEISEGGSPFKRFRQGPSLLGLENYGKDNEKRQHGHFVCKLSLNDEGVLEKYWPRVLVEKASGCRDFDHNTKFNRDKSGAVVVVHKKTLLQPFQPEESRIDINPDSHKIAKNSENLATSTDRLSSLIEDLEEEEQKKTKILPKFITKSLPHHQAIRKVEQAVFEKTLLESQCGLLISDWGLGRLGFIGTVIERLSKLDQVEVFRVSCNEFSSFEEMDNVFNQQMGFSFHETISLLANLPSSVLILDDFATHLLDETSDSTMLECFFQPLLDFCPNLKIIACTRQDPQKPLFPSVTLKALELPETQQYISKHDLSTDEVKVPSAIEALYLKSDGLPMHLDRLLEELQVSSLYEVLASADDIPQVSPEAEPVPFALKKAVYSISNSDDKFKRRSFKLLQVLSFFSHGETIADLKRFFPNEAFHPKNAVDLLKMDLVQIESPFDLSKMRGNNTSLFKVGNTGDIKRLVVPRQVRDYVLSIISEEDMAEIARASLFLFFGDNWICGNAVLLPKRRKALYDSMGMGPGNEHAVVKRHLKEEIRRGDEKRIRKAINLAINLAADYSSSSRYRDGAIAAEEYLIIASDELTDKERALLEIQLAKGLRMTGQREKALEMFNSVIEAANDLLTTNEKAELELLRTICFETLGDRENAIEAANHVLELAKKGSGIHDHAIAIKIGFEKDRETRIAKLSEHELEARKRKNTTVANNVALELFSELKDDNAKASTLQRVIDCQDDLYNRIRALLKKGNLATKANPAVSLTPKEASMIRQAYSFLFTQRLGNLFEDCHEVLWQICNRDGNLGDQLVMFRMSSFIWRLQGDIETEESYASKLRQVDTKELSCSTQSHLLRAIEYLKKRILFFFAASNEDE